MRDYNRSTQSPLGADTTRTIWYQNRMGIYETTLDGIRRAIADQYSSARKLSESADLNPNLVTRWLAGTRTPDFGKLSSLLDFLGAKIIFPDEERNRPTSYRTPEGEHLDQFISDMRKIKGATEEAVRDAAMKQLTAQFQKKSITEDTEERKSAI